LGAYGRLEGIVGNDDRVRITPTTSYPWSAIVKLYMTWGEDTFFATGAMIDENHVLTAGHCVYSHLHGGWADSIKVVPGEDNGQEIFGHAWVINIRCYSDWINTASAAHDFAVLTLDSNIGLQTGWFELYTTFSTNSIYLDVLNTAGYPFDLDDGKNMYMTYGNGISANEYNHWYYLDTMGGQSGSPIWVYDDINRYIVSVHTNGGISNNFGTRIDRSKFDCINNWLLADDLLIDKPDIAFESNSFSGFNPAIGGPSLTNFKVWCKIRNLGTKIAISFTVSYFASTDTFFSSQDYLLGSDIVSSLSPTSSIESSWSGILPDNIPSGEYFIGWIIDVENNLDEFNENNNLNYESTSKLIIDATPPLNPTNCIQLNGTTNDNILQYSVSNPNFIWSGASDIHSKIAGYYYYWGLNPNGISRSFTVAPEYNPPAVENGTYYLRASTEDIVGNEASWKTLYIFKYGIKNDSPDDNPDDNPIYDDVPPEFIDNSSNTQNDPPGDDSDDDFPEESNNTDKSNGTYDIIEIFFISSLIFSILCPSIAFLIRRYLRR